jgi:hypothetical protein
MLEVVNNGPIGHHNLNNELIGVDLTKRENNYELNFKVNISILSCFCQTYTHQVTVLNVLTHLKPLLSKADNVDHH